MCDTFLCEHCAICCGCECKKNVVIFRPVIGEFWNFGGKSVKNPEKPKNCAGVFVLVKNWLLLGVGSQGSEDLVKKATFVFTHSSHSSEPFWKWLWITWTLTEPSKPSSTQEWSMSTHGILLKFCPCNCFVEHCDSCAASILETCV